MNEQENFAFLSAVDRFRVEVYDVRKSRSGAPIRSDVLIKESRDSYTSDSIDVIVDLMRKVGVNLVNSTVDAYLDDNLDEPDIYSYTDVYDSWVDGVVVVFMRYFDTEKRMAFSKFFEMLKLDTQTGPDFFVDFTIDYFNFGNTYIPTLGTSDHWNDIAYKDAEDEENEP